MAPILGEIGDDLRAAFDEVEQIRKQNAISRASLSRAAGLSESTFNRLVYETDRTPHRKTVVCLRKALLSLLTEAAA